MKTYRGIRFDGKISVSIFEGKRHKFVRELTPALSHGIRNHSSSGFEWGYGGSGPAQLALAILADHFGPAEPPKVCPYCGSPLEEWRCRERESCGYDGEKEGGKWNHIQGGIVNYQDFKFDVVAKLPRQEWMLTTEQIAQWVMAHKAEEKV